MFQSLPLPFLFLLFCLSLLITLSASAWFTHRLEKICSLLGLSSRLLSLLGASGANIPNYAASIFSIASGQVVTGLGIIIGSNIYNCAIILAVAAFAAPGRHGLALPFKRASKEARAVRNVAGYSLAIVFTATLIIWLLPGTLLPQAIALPPLTTLALLAAIVSTFSLFAILVFQAFKAKDENEDEDNQETHGEGESERMKKVKQRAEMVRLTGEIVLALAIALGGVVVMVQSGQALTGALHMPPVLAGLLVLAVATSLPNTVVAFSLARDNRASACIEEIFSSNSINATLGIALPLAFWHAALNDRLLLILDAPLMVALTLIALVLAYRRRVTPLAGSLLVAVYVVWVVAHVWAG